MKGQRTKRLWTLRALSLALLGGIVLVVYGAKTTGILLPSLLFNGSLAIIVYVYVVYPLVLVGLSIGKKQTVRKKDIYPNVSLLIAAYNEETVIEEKLKNSLSLDYPREKLKIIVASDGSTDRTNEIATNFKKDCIILKDFRPRSGKISVLNKSINALDSEIIVLSDANTMYKYDAIKKLVRSFHDPSVGIVSGNVILLNHEVSFGKAENLYYKYERFIQKKESETGSIIGADGAMYAIRRELYLPPADHTIIDDFVVSMHVATQGKRVIYEPEAKGYEHTTPSFKEEFLRKARIIAGGAQALQERAGLPAFHQQMLMFKYLSHKVLRWAMPIFLLTLFMTNLFLLEGLFYRLFFAAQCGFYLLASLGTLFPRTAWFTAIPSYFCMVNLAAVVGIYRAMFNKQKVTWRQAPRR